MADHLSLKLQVDMQDGPITQGYPQLFIGKYEGGIYELTDSGSKIKVGEVKFMLLDAEGAYNDGHALDEVYDSDSDAAAYLPLLNKRRYRRTLVTACGGHPIPENALILDRVVIYPKFRGRGLGLQAIDMIVRRFKHGCGFAVLQVVPLQHGNVPAQKRAAWKLDALEPNPGDAQKMLTRHYEKAGFMKLRGTTDLMVYPYTE